MLFKPEHVEMILDGRKTETRRIWKRRMVKKGGVYKAQTKAYSKEWFAKIEVVDVYLEALCDISVSSIYAEGYDDLQGFIDIWKAINGEWNPHQEVWVIQFKVISLPEVAEIIDDPVVIGGERTLNEQPTKLVFPVLTDWKSTTLEGQIQEMYARINYLMDTKSDLEDALHQHRICLGTMERELKKQTGDGRRKHASGLTT